MRKIQTLLLCIFLALPIKCFSWETVKGYPEKALSLIGYSISGRYSKIAVLTVFPDIHRYGMYFSNDKMLKPINMRIALAYCGNAIEGNIVKYEIISDNKMDNITDCSSDIFASIQYNNTSTIYRFSQ